MCVYLQTERRTGTSIGIFATYRSERTKSCSRAVAFEDNMQFHISPHIPYLGTQKKLSEFL
jgi:hypothetical protein